MSVLYISDEMITRFIKEDVPYFDLTTHLLEIGGKQGRILYRSRQKAVISGTEVVSSIFGKLGITTVRMIPSGTKIDGGDFLIEGEGQAEDLHIAWKVGTNLLEYCSGIATRTNELVQAAKSIDPRIEIVTTRKIFPGTKELSIMAAIDGGALPHRLGLSETVLIFSQHRAFVGGIDGLLKKLDEIKARAFEKKIMVEVFCLEDAVKLARAGVDGLQFDKIPPSELKEIVDEVRAIHPTILLIATGGIHAGNVEQYASAGIHTINTSWVYFGAPVDIGVEMNEL